MPKREPIALCWSGGKDSSLAWLSLRENPSYRISALVTTFTEGYRRVSMHGVRYELLKRQAKAIGLPLEEVWIPPKASNAIYESEMAKTLLKLRETLGIRTVAFGDIFLEDLKLYREKQLADLDFKGLFPIWKRDTQALAKEFIERGFRGVTVCIDPRRLDFSFLGSELDESFFADLPLGCDPCGENGEYHSFVYQGPDWSGDVPFSLGETAERDSFLFRDLLPLEVVPDSNSLVKGVDQKS